MVKSNKNKKYKFFKNFYMIINNGTTTRVGGDVDHWGQKTAGAQVQLKIAYFPIYKKYIYIKKLF